MSDLPMLSTSQMTPLTDLDLYEEVTEAINNLHAVREGGLQLQVNVLDGVVTLSGVVLTRIMHRAVVQAAAFTPGVQKVIDALHTDPDIEVAVSQALAADAATKLYQSNVTASSYRGQVTLSGKVPDAEVAQAAQNIAGLVPGVTAVVNRLVAE